MAEKKQRAEKTARARSRNAELAQELAAELGEPTGPMNTSDADQGDHDVLPQPDEFAPHAGHLEEDQAWQAADAEAMAALDQDILAGKSSDMEAGTESDGPVEQPAEPQTEQLAAQVAAQPVAQVVDRPADNRWDSFPRSIPLRPIEEEVASFFKYTGGPFPSLLRAKPDPQAAVEDDPTEDTATDDTTTEATATEDTVEDEDEE